MEQADSAAPETATTPARESGSTTIADLLPHAAERYGAQAGGDVQGRAAATG